MVQVVRHKELNLTNLYVICLQFDLFTVSIFDALFILRVRFKVEMLAVKPRLVIFFYWWWGSQCNDGQQQLLRSCDPLSHNLYSP